MKKEYILVVKERGKHKLTFLAFLISYLFIFNSIIIIIGAGGRSLEFLYKGYLEISDAPYRG